MDTADLLLLTTARRLARTGEGRRIRTAAGLSLSEVSEPLGISPPTLSQWECARRAPRGERAIAWARLMNELQATLPTQVPA